MKRAGFTMIELIFVIVILGILAAVAIPKLAATRDDAKLSAEVTTTGQVIQNLGAEYTAQGEFKNYTIADANASTKCVTITAPSGSSDSATVTIVTDPAPECGSAAFITSVKNKLIANGLLKSDGGAKTFTFGGTGVSY